MKQAGLATGLNEKRTISRSRLPQLLDRLTPAQEPQGARPKRQQQHGAGNQRARLRHRCGDADGVVIQGRPAARQRRPCHAAARKMIQAGLATGLNEEEQTAKRRVP